MNKPLVLAGFVAGVVIGYNWRRIRRTTLPIVNALTCVVSGAVVAGMRVTVQAKEDMEDWLAERRAKQMRQVPAASPTEVEPTSIGILVGSSEHGQ